MTQKMDNKYSPIPEIEPDLARKEEEPTIPPFAAEKIWDECKKRSCCRQWKNYRLGDHLGSGSFGSTYRITDPYGRYAYCIKIARAGNANDTEKDVYSIFRNIPNVIEYVSSPEDVIHTFRTDENGNILEPIKTGGTYNAFKFSVYIMKLYDSSLISLKKSQIQLSEERLISLGIDLSSALVCIHNSGYIHTDVKPGNILIENRLGEAHPRYVLTDFNSVAQRRNDGSHTRTPERELVISFDFADPCLDETVRTPKYDIYGLASTMYWCANNYTLNRLVYDPCDDKKNGITTLFTHNLTKIPWNRSRPQNISDDLWQILSKAMDCNLKNRYQTAGEFRDALKTLLAKKQTEANNCAVSAHTDTPDKKPKKKRTAKKLPHIGEVIYTIFLIGAAFLVLSGWGYLAPGIPQNIAAYAYKDGVFVNASPEKVEHYYKAGAELGNANCAYQLGRSYDIADFTDHDTKNAIYFYSMAAKLGHEKAAKYLRSLRVEEVTENYDVSYPAEEGLATLKIGGVPHVVGLPYGSQTARSITEDWIDVVRFLGNYDTASGGYSYGVCLDMSLSSNNAVSLILRGSNDDGVTWADVQQSAFSAGNYSGIIIFELTPESLYDSYRIDLVSESTSVNLASSSPFVFTMVPAQEERPAAKSREASEVTTYETLNGDRATYLQTLNPAQQDFTCDLIESTGDALLSWNNLEYHFAEASKKLTLSLDYSGNKGVYNTLYALISEDIITDAEIEKATVFYPEMWASQLSSNTQLQENVMLDIPFDDWSSNSAYILLLCMDKEFNVLSHIIIRASNIPVNGLPSSDWAEIEGILHHKHGVDLNINYALKTVNDAEIVISSPDDATGGWTIIDGCSYSIKSAGTGKIWIRVNFDAFPQSENLQFKAYLFPKEYGEVWSPLASSLPVDSQY